MLAQQTKHGQQCGPGGSKGSPARMGHAVKVQFSSVPGGPDADMTGKTREFLQADL